jgi:hypothetical protein
MSASTTSSTLDRLAGVLRLRPGQARPGSVLNSRPDWAGALARGKHPAQVPALLASLYSLCGHAHRLCAQMALQVAEQGSVPADASATRALQWETLREHVRRIGLDWPAALAPATALEAVESLRSCPALCARDADMPQTRLWVERHVLHMPAADWLRRWDNESHWWAEWSASGGGWLPALVREAREAADQPLAGAAPLHVHAQGGSLRALAGRLREDAAYTRQPRWGGACAETGSWTRLCDADRPMPCTPWQRLGARVAELVRLSLPDMPGARGGGWLATGALQITPGEGLAWVEMARGLLVHHAVVENAAAPRVASYRVLAPTEWNFHAEGAVAAALEGLCPAAGASAQRQVAALMAAYDPCVRYEVQTQAVDEEQAHA